MSNLIYGSGTDPNVDATGHLTALNADGSVKWTYTSANADYVLGVAVGDVDGDGDDEVAVSFHMTDHIGSLISKTGALLWSYDLGANNYCRGVAIGKVRADYTGNQVVFGGRNGTLSLCDKDGNVIWEKKGATALCAPSCGGGSGDTVQSIALGDTDQDGQNEIVIGYGATVRQFDETGTQEWSTTVGDANSWVFGVAVGKITSAAGLQIAAAVTNGAGTGGAVNQFVVLDKDGDVLWTYPAPNYAWCVAAGDVNDDGLDEVIIGYGRHGAEPPPAIGGAGVSILNNLGVALAHAALGASPKFILCADVDGDGAREIVAPSDDGNVYIVEITGL